MRAVKTWADLTESNFSVAPSMPTNCLNNYLKERKPSLPLRHARPQKKTIFPSPVVAKRTEGEQYYVGPMPTIELKFGLFLYYSGVVFVSVSCSGSDLAKVAAPSRLVISPVSGAG